MDDHSSVGSDDSNNGNYGKVSALRFTANLQTWASEYPFPEFRSKRKGELGDDNTMTDKSDVQISAKHEGECGCSIGEQMEANNHASLYDDEEHAPSEERHQAELTELLMEMSSSSSSSDDDDGAENAPYRAPHVMSAPWMFDHHRSWATQLEESQMNQEQQHRHFRGQSDTPHHRSLSAVPL